MLWLKLVLGLVVVVVGYVVIAGNTLESRHVASVSRSFARPPADVWTAITDHASQPTWRKDLKSIEMLASVDGKTTFRETGPVGLMTMVVDESVAPKHYVTRIADDNLGFGGRWIFDLEPADGGTRLTITEEGEVKSLLFRALSPFFSKTASIEGYLAALDAKFAADAQTATTTVVIRR